MMAACGGTSASKRRRERRLRLWWRHERMSVAAALAEDHHHSEPKVGAETVQRSTEPEDRQCGDAAGSPEGSRAAGASSHGPVTWLLGLLRSLWCWCRT